MGGRELEIENQADYDFANFLNFYTIVEPMVGLAFIDVW